MKTILVSFVCVLFLTAGVNAQHTSHSTKKTTATQKNVALTDSFKVEGACEMCKERIESVARKVPGVNSASWNISTHMLKIQRKTQTKVADVQKAVAAVGHDTKDFKAPDAVYNKLPGCCKYR